MDTFRLPLATQVEFQLPDDHQEEDEEDVLTKKALVVRLPAKTNLSNVLLTSNPWAKRDLDKRLLHLSEEKSRRSKILDWTQRHFFVNQVFDQDYNLKFTKDRPPLNSNVNRMPLPLGALGIEQEPRHVTSSNLSQDVSSSQNKLPRAKQREHCVGHSDNVQNPQIAAISNHDNDIHNPQLDSSIEDVEQLEDSTTSSSTSCSVDTGRRRPSLEVQRLGIFLNPQVNEPRRPPKAKQRHKLRKLKPKTDGEKSDEGATISISCDRKLPTLRLTTAALQSLNSTSESGLRKAQSTNTAPSSDQGKTECNRPRICHKASSFPQIKAHRRVLLTELSTEETGRRSPRPEPHVNYRASLTTFNSTTRCTPPAPTSVQHVTTPRGDGKLCDDDVILRITRTLPMSMLIRANQNVNKLVEIKKEKMLRRCRQESQKDALSDPRWLRLKDSLEKPDIHPKSQHLTL